MNDDAQIAKLRASIAANTRQLRRLWVRLGTSGGGTAIRWVTLDAPLWRGQDPVTGTAYSNPDFSASPLAESVDVQATAGHGYYVASPTILHAAVSAGNVYELVGSGLWHLSTQLATDLSAGGEAETVSGFTVYAPWAPGPETPLAESGDSIGISWNDFELRWEATLGGCQDDAVVEAGD